MKLLRCPLNGPRNISEFVYLGEVKPLPAADAEPDRWAASVFLESNPAGVVREWWLHAATNHVFIVDRDTRTDTVLATHPVDAAPPAAAARPPRGERGGSP